MQTMRHVAIPRRASLAQVGSDATPLVAGFLGLQFFLGYEWLMSGLSKLVAGNFAAGLGGTLSDMTQDQGGWYKSLLDALFIPNAQLFGNLVMVGELALGAIFIVGAVVLLTWRSVMTSAERTLLLSAMTVAAFVGAFMSLNFHLATGAPAPWVVSPDPNDQGVDLDSLMVVMQLVLGGASLRQLLSVRA